MFDGESGGRGRRCGCHCGRENQGRKIPVSGNTAGERQLSITLKELMTGKDNAK